MQPHDAMRQPYNASAPEPCHAMLPSSMVMQGILVMQEEEQEDLYSTDAKRRAPHVVSNICCARWGV